MDKKEAKEKLEERAKKANKLADEFREFISRGNVIDLAVGVIIGGAFGKIVSSLVDNIIMPLIGVLMGGVDFSSLSIDVANAHISYGVFIQNIIDFLIIAVCIFVFIKIINSFHKKTNTQAKGDNNKSKEEDEQLAVLKEIRDTLAKN